MPDNRNRTLQSDQLQDSRCVFVVEDERVQQFALHSILTSAGFDVATFDSAEEFLEVVGDLPGGCVVTDLNMPGMSGLELQAALLHRWDDFRVILMSAGIDSVSHAKAMKAGAVAVLDKLTWYDVLEDTVNRAFRSLDTGQLPA